MKKPKRKATRPLKLWWVLMTPTGDFLRCAEMCRTQVRQLNRYFKKNECDSRWVLYSVFFEDVQIGRSLAL